MVWPAYMTGGNEHDARVVLSCWARQKILRKNSHVPWPVHPTSTIKSPDRIHRGSRTPGLSPHCYLDARNGIVLGDNVWIGPHSKLISMNHNLDDFNCYEMKQPIRIDSNSWIGAGATILAGVHLGPHTVVGAAAVVTKSFPDGNRVIAGNPARVVKLLSPYRTS